MKNLEKILVESGLSKNLASACCGSSVKKKVSEQQEGEAPEVDYASIIQMIFTLLGKQDARVFEDAKYGYESALLMIRSLFKKKSLIMTQARKTASRGAKSSVRMAKKGLNR